MAPRQPNSFSHSCFIERVLLGLVVTFFTSLETSAFFFMLLVRSCNCEATERTIHVCLFELCVHGIQRLWERASRTWSFQSEALETSSNVPHSATCTCTWCTSDGERERDIWEKFIACAIFVSRCEGEEKWREERKNTREDTKSSRRDEATRDT